MQRVAGGAARQVASCLRREAAAAPAGRHIHASVSACSALKPGPVETKLRKQLAEFKLPEALDLSVIKPGPDGKRQYRCVPGSLKARRGAAAFSGASASHTQPSCSLPCSAKIKRIASEIASLTLLETVDLTAVLKDTLKMTDKCVPAWAALLCFRAYRRSFPQ